MNELLEAGKELIEYAEQADFTAQRGLIDELFPFIYVASKRMSLRAICRWLKENHRIQISVNAVSKAMRNQETYWTQLVELVEPSARIMAETYNMHPYEVLDNFEFFKHLETETPSVVAEDSEGIERELQQVAVAVGVLRNRWFNLPEEVRNQCRRFFVSVFFDVEETKKEENKK